MVDIWVYGHVVYPEPESMSSHGILGYLGRFGAILLHIFGVHAESPSRNIPEMIMGSRKWFSVCSSLAKGYWALLVSWGSPKLGGNSGRCIERGA